MSAIAPEQQQADAAGFPAGLSYTAYAAYRVRDALGGRDSGELAARTLAAIEDVDGVAVRGTYDTSGLRSDCDLLIWMAGPSAQSLQHAQSAIRRSDLGSALEPFWQAAGVHREAEFSKSHIPAFYAGEPARAWLCAYPFVRTPEWYLLEPERRRALLVEHGRMGRAYPDVRAWPDPVHRSTCCESWWLVGSCRVVLPPASDGAGA